MEEGLKIKKRKTSVGGQAVIEGVMMRGKKQIATAVRVDDNTIKVDEKECNIASKRFKILSLPIIRGFIALIESLIIGINSLNYSASLFEEYEEESKFDKWFESIFKDKSNDVLVGISLVLGVVFASVLFFIIPTVLASFIKKYLTANTIILNIAEGVIRVLIFFLYVVLIGKLDDIERTYMYHGAEHKTIACYEAGEKLTPENAQKYTRFHPRCGTNFLFLVMIISIMIFSLTGWESVWQRIISRLLLLPVVTGVTYEVIRFLGKSESKLAKMIAKPGLMLQKLTTKEPDLKMLEVAIIALKSAEGIEVSKEEVKDENSTVIN
ncbi:DUF1385 domain-containing protein [Clostridium senegalense]|uniref:DUF1385 domain-containing protein n=1 Tax=Clostridium senegalense TaxID=1465809 RepID=UPI001C0F976F|nr:DUF1385 domain-containing protein [Clostridium senegalense]MBU5227454.1 DUF1385 domain-containing protein [Clostridium senegalense]